jgi:hypothetical protein
MPDDRLRVFENWVLNICNRDETARLQKLLIEELRDFMLLTIYVYNWNVRVKGGMGRTCSIHGKECIGAYGGKGRIQPGTLKIW